jgi:hypothetical protein
MGFNRNMPLEVVFGPTSIGGLGLRHCMSNKAAKDLCVATTHPAEQSPRTNDVDRTPVDASYSGVGFAILAEPWRLLPHAKSATGYLLYVSSSPLRVYDRDRKHIYSMPPTGHDRSSWRTMQGTSRTVRYGRSAAGYSFRSNVCRRLHSWMV